MLIYYDTQHNRSWISTFPFFTAQLLLECCFVAWKKGLPPDVYILYCHIKLAFFLTIYMFGLRKVSAVIWCLFGGLFFSFSLFPFFVCLLIYLCIIPELYSGPSFRYLALARLSASGIHLASGSQLALVLRFKYSTLALGCYSSSRFDTQLWVFYYQTNQWFITHNFFNLCFFDTLFIRGWWSGLFILTNCHFDVYAGSTKYESVSYHADCS